MLQRKPRIARAVSAAKQTVILEGKHGRHSWREQSARSPPQQQEKISLFPSRGQRRASQAPRGPCSPSSTPVLCFNTLAAFCPSTLLYVGMAQLQLWPNPVLLSLGWKCSLLPVLLGNLWRIPAMGRTPTRWPPVSFCDSNISINWPARRRSAMPLLELLYISPVAKAKCYLPKYSLLVSWSCWGFLSLQSIAVKRHYRASLFLSEKMTVCTGVWSRAGLWVILIINSNEVSGLGPISVLQCCKEYLYS